MLLQKILNVACNTTRGVAAGVLQVQPPSGIALKVGRPDASKSDFSIAAS